MERTGSTDPSDWTTIWQSELSGLAVDREAHEALSTLAQAWPAPTIEADRTGHDGPAGRSGPDAPSGATPAGAASGPGDELARLRQRVAELEAAALPHGA